MLLPEKSGLSSYFLIDYAIKNVQAAECECSVDLCFYDWKYFFSHLITLQQSQHLLIQLLIDPDLVLTFVSPWRAKIKIVMGRTLQTFE